MFTIAIRNKSGPPSGPQFSARLEFLNYQLRMPDIRAVPLPHFAFYLRLWNLSLFKQFQQLGVAKSQNGRYFLCG
jgi:hypothetical protein